MITIRKPGQPGYLGPASEAQRAREIVQASRATLRRPTVQQQGFSELPLFADTEAPRLF
jgi:hypothetical protein